MKFWNDDLRVCPKCKNAVTMGNESRIERPHCHSRVWFFNYKPIPDHPELPELHSDNLRKNPTTTLLLASTALFGLVSIFAFHNGVLTSTVCGLAAIIFAVFAFVRHAEAKNIESSLDYLSFMKLYVEIMRN